MAHRNPTVRMRHPKTGGHYNAPPSAVAFWGARGWKKADAPDTKTTTTAKVAEKKES